jgi:hypothetical protein
MVTLRTLRWLVFIALIGCGRIAFDPVDDARNGSAANPDGSTGDAGGGSDGGIDAVATACAAAIPIGAGQSITVDTCSTGMDLLDGCGPAGTQEVVFAFTVPATGGYNFRALDSGTNTVSNSTGLVTAACDGTVTCAGILGRTYTGGDTVYFAIEASSGGCVTIDFENF